MIERSKPLSMALYKTLQCIADGDHRECNKEHMYKLLLAGYIIHQRPNWVLTVSGRAALANAPDAEK